MTGLQIPKGLIVRSDPARRGDQPVLRLDYRRFGEGGMHVTEKPDFAQAAKSVQEAHALMLEGTSDRLKDGPVVMTGWKTESPFVPEQELVLIERAASALAGEVDDVVSIGIGGSYLGLEAVVNAIMGSLPLTNLLPREARANIPRLFFLGQNMDPRYISTVLQILQGNRVGAVVISKSGGTVEPAIAFAIIRSLMDSSFTNDEVARRIVAITDKAKGALKGLADQQGYATFVVPDNVGGRYSVTCPVGLFVLAVAGVNIREFVAGAKAAEQDVRKKPFDQNIAMLRAAMRFIAHKDMGKVTEFASTGTFDLIGTTMWMQQLGPESEGKNGEGLLIVPQYYTRDLHADGQLIQEGPRNLIETFIMVEDPGVDVIIPGKGTPVGYVDGNGLHWTNTAFVEGARNAHFEGGVPTMSYILSHIDAYTIGYLLQTEMNVIAMSGLALGQNPFIQPGVQLYKAIADALSRKPGTEARLVQIVEAEQALNLRFIA